jgi:hypothetical protein
MFKVANFSSSLIKMKTGIKTSYVLVMTENLGSAINLS